MPAPRVKSKLEGRWSGTHALIRWTAEDGQHMAKPGETIHPGEKFRPTLPEARDFRDLILIDAGDAGAMPLGTLWKTTPHPLEPQTLLPDFSDIEQWFYHGVLPTDGIIPATFQSN